MVKGYYILCALVIALLVVSAGCSNAQSGSPSTGGQPTAKKTTTTAVPDVGTIKVSSSPWGASVYLDGSYRGATPLNITDVPVGKHEIQVTMADYAAQNGTVDVKGGQVVSFSKTLAHPTAKVVGQIDKAQNVYGGPCKWIFSGTLTNSGEIAAQEVTLTATMNPAKSEFSKGTKTITVGTVGAGQSKDFYVEVPVDCGGEYKSGTVTFKYTDKYDKKYSGSITF